MKRRYKITLLAGILLSAMLTFSGCTTTEGGSGTNWELINQASRTSIKWATKLVLDKNPSYAEQVSAINSGIAVIFTGELTKEGVTLQVKALAPQLSDGDANTYASAVMDAYGAYVAATGDKVLVSTDERVTKLVDAITKGISEGIELHKVGI